MQRQYYISHDGNVLGMFSLEDIVKKIHAGEVLSQDYIFHDESQQWILIQDAEMLKPLLSQPKEQKSNHEQNTTKQEDQWFVLKGQNQTGPFSYHTVILLLQEKAVFEFDYVWKPGMEEWRRIAELPDFKPESIRDIKNTGGPEVKNIFFRRRFNRREYGSTLIIHDNKKVWNGQALEISEGGAGVVLQNSSFLPGQTLYLHFRASSEVPAFNALVEVVGKRYSPDVKNLESPVIYGVKFLKIQDEVRSTIQAYASKQVA